MLPIIRAEFRKLLTVRSTYAISGFALVLVGFIAFYGMGYKGWAALQPSSALQEHLLNAISIYQVFAAIVAMLLITHEYRYNTIMHTLTISNSRFKVLLAKIIVATIYGAAFTLIGLALTGLEIAAGVNLGGHGLGVQHLDIYSLLWRSLVFTCGGVLVGLVFGFLSRSIVFALTAFFIIPSTIEPLLHLLLKVNENYLPFTVQGQIIAPGGPGAYSALASAGVFLAYLASAWVIAAVLFIRRDAN
jgi:ABC-type transport system involved in multi-copper enzyme maturation permease subunit